MPLWSVNAYNRARSPRAKPVANIDLVIAGHVGSLSVEVSQNQFWIDTCSRSGTLSLLSADQLFEFERVSRAT